LGEINVLNNEKKAASQKKNKKGRPQTEKGPGDKTDVTCIPVRAEPHLENLGKKKFRVERENRLGKP